MIIRKATKHDKDAIAQCLLLAMEDIIYEFIGMESYEGAKTFMNALVEQDNNQYSYQNCWVAEENDKVIAAVAAYDGGKLEDLKKPVAQYVQDVYNKSFSPEEETQAGEFYIDSFGVHPDQQGKGIGSKLLLFLIDEYVRKHKGKLGLLVDKENPNAKKLYLKLGFKVVGEKALAGKQMEHLQIG